ncbi:MAG: hypothetical protein ACE5DX_04085 [Candidatus Dojkabacteria bacterium]
MKDKKSADKSASKKQKEVVSITFKKPNTMFIVAVALGVLALGQTVLILQLSNKVSAQDVNNLVNSGSSGSATIEQLKDLPDMVGGC